MNVFESHFKESILLPILPIQPRWKWDSSSSWIQFPFKIVQKRGRNTAEKLMLQFLVLPGRSANSSVGFLFIFLGIAHRAVCMLSTKRDKKPKIQAKTSRKRGISSSHFIQQRQVHRHSTNMQSISFYPVEKSHLKLVATQ